MSMAALQGLPPRTSGKSFVVNLDSGLLQWATSSVHGTPAHQQEQVMSANARQADSWNVKVRKMDFLPVERTGEKCSLAALFSLLQFFPVSFDAPNERGFEVGFAAEDLQLDFLECCLTFADCLNLG